MKRRINILFVLVIFVFTLSACAQRTAVQKVSVDQVKADLHYQNIIFRDFTAAPDVVSPEKALNECKEAATDYLRKKNIFKLVDDDTNKTYNEPTLFVDVKLLDLRIVSGKARFWGGALAGRSHMKINVRLIDANGKLISEKELLGAPNALGSAYSFGGSDRRLTTNAGVMLSDFILANVSGK